MKKYHQLILLIFSIISLVLFLIYRHEYNRLHYVLEVFNFFGQPCNFSDLQTTDFILRQQDWGPQPMWQETDNGYVYSAFLTGKMKIKAIALPRDSNKLPKNCYIWLEDKKKPISGKFSYSKIVDGGGSSLVPHFYYCSAEIIDNTPFAVSFTSVVKKEVNMKKILLTDVTGSRNLNINTTICVLPSNFSKKKFVEFFSFHRLLGVDSFIFYNKDIPYRLSKLMINLSNRLDVQLAFLPWNFPKIDIFITRVIIENDCLLRTHSRSNFVAILEYNEYIVPTISYSINDIVKDLKDNVYKLSLPVQKFCINNANVNKPLALQNFEVATDARFNSVHFVFNNVNNNAVDTNNLDRTKASIHKYVKCENNIKTTTDFSMNKFSTDFIRSTLVQLLIHNQL
ncbi:unnamed protein product [Psylliodes chrysocephalus]|uniref:Glycosyltransferase family 92 protein n=1 Tax=Psylliodes chrysocephalus TaxID=3402493 RepID=A0A9P0CSQ0_9CUCU|nr:unnamed protein product [Psylliodes chrysocephala]